MKSVNIIEFVSLNMLVLVCLANCFVIPRPGSLGEMARTRDYNPRYLDPTPSDIADYYDYLKMKTLAEQYNDVNVPLQRESMKKRADLGAILQHLNKQLSRDENTARSHSFRFGIGRK